MEFQYTGHIDRLLFCGKQDSGLICIKFVQIYSRPAHEHLATLKCAPKLRGFQSIGGGWSLVVMDMLSGYETLHDYKGGKPHSSAVETLRNNLCSLHGAGYVHGDIRHTNIMVSGSGDHLMVVDFDWAGEAGVARYPSLVNFRDIDRPSDARDGLPITKEHDHFMIDRIEALECPSHVRCTHADR